MYEECGCELIIIIIDFNQVYPVGGFFTLTMLLFTILTKKIYDYIFRKLQKSKIKLFCSLKYV